MAMPILRPPAASIPIFASASSKRAWTSSVSLLPRSSARPWPELPSEMPSQKGLYGLRLAAHDFFKLPHKAKRETGKPRDIRKERPLTQNGTPPKRASAGKRRRPGAQSKKRQAHQAFAVFEPCGGISDAVVTRWGFEPQTHCLKGSCSTD